MTLTDCMELPSVGSGLQQSNPKYVLAQVIKVPKMGDSISEGTVQTFVKSKLRFICCGHVAHINVCLKTYLEIKKTKMMLTECYIEAGDFVQADEVVAVIETDKVNVDIRSTHSGVI
jgi:hypothetical protein